ncbi:MAG: DNA primase [Pseudomonadota bacterium]|nr:DNA primase [Pseudomonadota bacterium]
MTEDISSFTKIVLSQTDIVSVVQQYVSLKKTGSNYQGLCPFHTEKSPSFSVNSNKQFFYCFGCHASGDAINFIMKHENMSFMEALEKLATPLGLSLPVREKDQRQVDKNVYKLMRDMALSCKHDLLCKGPQYHYLLKRGITEQTMTKFHVGYCGSKYLSWFDQYKRSNPKDFLDFGIASQQKSMSLRPKFFKRLMFPIQDSVGKVIAFGARTLDGSMPKYLNSPETDIFKKRHSLYGLHQFKSLKQHTVYVVEGYMDVLSLHSHNVPNAVACLGTAFTLSHWNLLKKFASKIIFCFDGDKAGRNAAWKSLESVLSVLDPSIKLYFLFLPDQHDPDSYIQKNGKQSFLKISESAISWIEFFIMTQQQRHNPYSLDEKAAFLDSSRALINKMTNQSLKDVVASEIENILKISISKPAAPRHDKASTDISKIQTHSSALLAYLSQKDSEPLSFLNEFDNICHDPVIDIINQWVAMLANEPELTGESLLSSCQGDDRYSLCLSIISKQSVQYDIRYLQIQSLSLTIELIDYLIHTQLLSDKATHSDDDKKYLQALILKKKMIEKARHDLQTSIYDQS